MPAAAQIAASYPADDAKHPPSGYQAMIVGGVAPTAQGNAVVLTDEKSTVAVLIFIGGTEALSIALRLQRRHYDRPLTHDLLDDVIKKLGSQVLSARVDSLENNVFHGTLVVRDHGKRVEVDARPSDALAMAVGSSVPIFVSKKVIDQAGVDLKSLDVRPPDSFDPEKPPEERPGVEL
jgi:bifunctional DNase/RNase